MAILPRRQSLAITVTTGNDVSVTATANVNFKTGRIAALVHFPLVITTASLNLVFADNKLFARSAEVTEWAVAGDESDNTRTSLERR